MKSNLPKIKIQGSAARMLPQLSPSHINQFPPRKLLLTSGSIPIFQQIHAAHFLHWYGRVSLSSFFPYPELFPITAIRGGDEIPDEQGYKPFSLKGGYSHCFSTDGYGERKSRSIFRGDSRSACRYFSRTAFLPGRGKMEIPEGEESEKPIPTRQTNRRSIKGGHVICQCSSFMDKS